jgi:hypothetical protein
MDTLAQLKAECGVAAGLMSVPMWAAVVSNVSLIASCVVAVCGAIVGLRAVYLLCLRYWK